MALTYRDVMTTDLSFLLSASEEWKDMGDKFGTLTSNYNTHVRAQLANGNWYGRGYNAAVQSGTTTTHELRAAKKEAHEVADLLEKAYRELNRLKEALKGLVKDARKEGYKVDPLTGQVTTDYDAKKFQDMTPEELQAYKKDPEAVAAAERAWTQVLKEQVKELDKADFQYRGALEAVGKDADGKGVKGGFNGSADAGTALAAAPKAKASRSGTKTDGWNPEGTASANGPDAGFSAVGPGYGKEGMVKAYADLGHATAEGSLTKGQMKLSGIADGYFGIRGTASAGITDEGIAGNAEVSAGARALAEGRLSSDVAGVYGRGTGFAGGEAGADISLGSEGFNAGGKAFAGAKAGGATGAEAGGIGVGVTGEAWAGAGVEADLIFGERDGDGKFHIGAEVGASPILGGKVGMEFTIDPGKVADTTGDAVDALGDVAGDVGDVAGSVKDGVTSIF